MFFREKTFLLPVREGCLLHIEYRTTKMNLTFDDRDETGRGVVREDGKSRHCPYNYSI